MDHIFERKLFSILSRILENVEYREAYDANVPNRRFEGILGGRRERPIIQKVGLLLDIRGLEDVSVWHEAFKAIDSWFYDHTQNVSKQVDLSIGIISTEGYSFKRLLLYPLGFYQHLRRDLAMTMIMDVHDWTEALTIFSQKARLYQIDLLIIVFPCSPKSVAENKAIELKRLLRSMKQRIIWLIGPGSSDKIKSIDPTYQARCLQYPQSTVSCADATEQQIDISICQPMEWNTTMHNVQVPAQSTSSTPFIENLKLFNRKERFHLIGCALGNPLFTLSTDFMDKISKMFSNEFVIPDTAFVAMDYHLDWIYASLFLASGKRQVGQMVGKNKSITILKRDETIIKANNEDSDLYSAS